MNVKERNFYNAFVRIREFGNENTADFPVGSAGANNFAVVGAAVVEIEQASAKQVSGVSGQATTNKNIALTELREDLRNINRTARALAVDNSSISLLFQMPIGNNEQNLLATARAFLTNTAPLKNQFIEYGLSADFIEDLQADIEAAELAINEKNVTKGKKVSATASIGEAVNKGLEGLRRLRAIVPNIYRNNPAKLAAWTSASHIERSARKKEEISPPTV